ncbi:MULTISPECIES: aspartate kinase [Dialister]|jgi:aspartate kinase|uniref:Aspartokinase n=1 Tax=Dialister hominis TaxID=2582419 RepID=A0A8D5A166_9FIRM|nr:MULTISPECIES: aspartate kinase [Dialister]UYJ16365.1 MAG: aspartate kinase [Veillonellaceae bacterium]MBS6413100.1 aspartate kinase [Dialister sp.]MCH3912318.1 aspartate kinase [Dialister sp.]MCH3929927.1 aspartate kinase [Dialister sp.]MEE1348556.1 aspartate kinase [Dialister hominis]
MALYVKKFGGSSVATPEKMLNIANRVLRDRKPGDKIVIVVSAMGDSTDDLLDLAAKVSDVNYARERDMLLSTGEQVSIALMAMTFKKLGVPAISLTGPQAGIVAGGGYGKATIDDVKPDRVFKELEAGNIVIVAGFQGMMPNGDIATLGRGGSDATAVALAGAMHADMCEIFTDVDGVYSADPRHVTGTIKMKEITNTEMLEMARLGAGVMQPRSVELGMKYHIPIHVRSTFTDEEGTIIREVCTMETRDDTVRGVAQDAHAARIAVLGLRNIPGVAYKIFSVLAENNITVDMIVQSVRNSNDDKTDIIFTIDDADLSDAKRVLDAMRDEGKVEEVIYDDDTAKVSVVGAGMLGRPGVAARMFGALGRAGVNIDIVSTSEISISCLILRKDLDKAVQAIHDEFFTAGEGR